MRLVAGAWRHAQVACGVLSRGKAKEAAMLDVFRHATARAKWGDLIAEFGVLWITFGWLDGFKDRGQAADIFWFVGITIVGLAAMRLGVWMKCSKINANEQA